MFSAPAAVFVDPSFLKTLDRRQLVSGFAEIIKHALIADAGYWKKVKEFNLSDTGSFDEMIETSVGIKNEVVTKDPKEKNIRKRLNFGHTIGHAIETFSLENDDKKPLLHGEAIAVGMICEAYLSNKINKLSDVELNEITQFILSKYKTIKLEQMDNHRLIELMKHDKKNDKGDINFSLLSSIGHCDINKTAKADLIIDSLRYYLQEAKLFK